MNEHTQLNLPSSLKVTENTILSYKKEHLPWRGRRRRPAARRPRVDSESPPQGSSSSPKELPNMISCAHIYLNSKPVFIPSF